MKNFIKHFKRHSDGSWECVSYADLYANGGRIEVTAGSRFMPGTRIMGVDLAQWLDRQRTFDTRQ